MDDDGETEDYKKRRAEFAAKVLRFHEQRGTPLKRLPMLGGRELNIYHLYEEVQKRGGSEKVTKVRMWGEIARTFNLPSTVTSASYAIRNHFIKLLEQFEADENGIVLDHTPSPSPSPSSLPSLPILPSLPRPLPLYKKPTALTPPPPPYTTETDVGLSKLARALLSGLPNEVDFAFNVLLILSNSNALSIQKAPCLLDVILAHVAVFTDGDPGLESMYREAWYPDSELDFLTFWETSVPEWVFSIILGAPIKKSLYECLLFNRGSLLLRGEATPTAGEATPPGGSDEGVEGLRVAQVSTVLCNLSTNDTSAKVLADNPGILRFLVLGVSCDLPSVRIPALDCLANLATHLILCYDSEVVDTPEYVLVTTLQQCVLSEDRFSVKRGIEILGKLAWSITNSALLLSTPSEVYRRMLNILLLPDCELTMIVLDTLYSLSQLGREVAEVIASVRGLIDVLVWLLSFRVENLPTESLARIKLYFIGDSSSLAQYLAEIQGKPTTSSSPTTTTSTTSSPNVAGSGLNVTGGTTLTGKGGVASPLTTNQIRSRPMILTRASSPLTTNQIVSRGAQSVSITSQSLIKGIGKLAMLGSGSLHSILSALSQTNSRNKPNEEFAIEWLKQSYEVQASHHLVLLVDMYAQYVLHCSAKGKREFLNNTEFINVLRQVFPGSQTREVKTVAKKVIHFLTGLRRITTQPHKLTPPLTNHTPLTTPATTSIFMTTSVNSSPLTSQLTTTSSTSSNPSTNVAHVGAPVASFGHKSSSVVSVGSRSISSNPPSSLSLCSTSTTSSATSSRDSTPQPTTTTTPDCETNDIIITSQLDRNSKPTVEVNQLTAESVNPVAQTTTPLAKQKRALTPIDAYSDISDVSSTCRSDHMVTMEMNSLPRVGYSLLSSPLSSRAGTPESLGGSDVIDVRNDVISKKPAVHSSSPMDADFTVSTNTPSPGPHNDTTSESREQPQATLPSVEVGAVKYSQGTVKYSPGPENSNDGNRQTFCDDNVETVTPKRPLISGRSLKSVLSSVNDVRGDVAVTGGEGGEGGLAENSGWVQISDCEEDKHMECRDGVNGTKKSVDRRSKCVEPASTVSRIDQSLTPNHSGDSVPRAKRIRITSPVHESKQQQQQTPLVSLNPIHPTTHIQQSLTRQTSYTTSSIRFLGKSPVANSTAESISVANQSNRSQTSSSDSVRPVCLWDNCMSMRYSWSDLLHHTVTCHISHLPTHTPSPCHWVGCTTASLRRKPSLIRHVETHHCSPGPKPIPPSISATLAKLKHCPSLQTELESPLTKAVRVTAALVLRNLCKEAPSSHKLLRRHEHTLSQVALSSREAANTLSDCLYYLTLPPPSSLPSPSSPSSPPSTDTS